MGDIVLFSANAYACLMHFIQWVAIIVQSVVSRLCHTSRQGEHWVSVCLSVCL